MNKKLLIGLGVAGAVAAGAFIGGPAVLSSGEHRADHTADDVTGGYQQQLREYERAKQELLDSLVFYEGTATIQESYSAISGVAGDTPVVGSVAMVSEDLMVYDPATDKCHLVARRLSLLGDDVKNVDTSIYKGSISIKVVGSLTEYYGNGVLTAYDVVQALDGKKGYYLNFSPNPVRVDCPGQIVYTNPPPRKTYWVQVFGPDEVDLVATAVFTPEELPYPEAGQIPHSAINGERTYNAGETLIYEYTGGKIIPKGSFSFSYQKRTYAEIKDFLQQLIDESQSGQQLAETAEALSDAWQDVVSAHNQMESLSGSSKMMDGIMANGAGASAQSQAESLAFGPEFRGELNSASESLDGLEGEGGSLRKLESFSLEGSDNSAGDAVKGLLPKLDRLLGQYRQTLLSLRDAVDGFAKGLSENRLKPEDIEPVLAQMRAKVGELRLIGDCIDRMSADLSRVLLGFQSAKGAAKTESAALTALCETWSRNIDEFLSGTAPAVDILQGIAIPDDYPADIVPLPQGSVAALYSVDADRTISLTLKTDLNAGEVITFYRSALKNAANLTAFDMNGMHTLSGEIGQWELSILATANQLGGSEATMVQITLIPS